MRASTRRRLSWCVAGLALCLGAAVFAEVAPGIRNRPVDRTPAAVTLSLPAPSAPDAPPIDDWVSTALDRPLFAPDRRPDATAAAPNAMLPRLSGIIRVGGTSIAMFQPSTGDGAGQSLLVANGAEVSGWTITDITDAEVTLVRQSQIATLRLSFANRPAGAHRVVKAVLTVLHDKRTNAFLQP